MPVFSFTMVSIRKGGLRSSAQLPLTMARLAEMPDRFTTETRFP